MARVNLMLLIAVVLCAIGVVAATHKSRRLFSELEREQERARQLEVEWGQLQLEQSTWAGHARIETIARDKLQMRAPAPGSMLAVDAPEKK